MTAMWIMIAGPYRSGAADDEQRAANLKTLNEAALQVHRLGHVPLVGVNIALPLINIAGDDHFDELMMPISLALAERRDAILRLDGPSGGADRETDVIRTNGGQVFSDLADIPAV